MAFNLGMESRVVPIGRQSVQESGPREDPTFTIRELTHASALLLSGNRIVKITKAGNDIAEFSYDALASRVEKKDLIDPNNTRRYYYNYNLPRFVI